MSTVLPQVVAILVLVLAVPGMGASAADPAINELRSNLQRAMAAHDGEKVSSIANDLMVKAADDPNVQVQCGECLYRVGRVVESLKAFDRAIELAPASKPYLWQRGIALYDAGRFAEGKEQFEVHRTVNGNDVENATWHYLCVAAMENADAARKQLLPAPGDARIPMQQVYDLYAGTLKPEEVTAAVDALPADSPQAVSARFYAELYLGLWHQAAGRIPEAKLALRRALDTKLGGYMYDVAKVRLDLLP